MEGPQAPGYTDGPLRYIFPTDLMGREGFDQHLLRIGQVLIILYRICMYINICRNKIFIFSFVS